MCDPSVTEALSAEERAGFLKKGTQAGVHEEVISGSTGAEGPMRSHVALEGTGKAAAREHPYTRAVLEGSQGR